MNKVFKFSINKTSLCLIFITIIGFLFRIWHIDKGGLWFDELHCYYQASSKFPFEIFRKAFLVDAHAPLYYYLLRLWMDLFGDADTTLRYLSLFIGTLNIPIAYYAGKEIISKKAGLLAAGLFSINSFLIYYSQEVKFYSLLALCTTAIIWSLAKIHNSQEKNNNLALIILAISNLIIIYTFTIGILFVFIEVVIFLIYLFIYKKEKAKSFFISNSYTALLALPFVYGLYYRFIGNNFLYTWNYSFEAHKFLFNIKKILFGFFSPVFDYTGNISIWALISLGIFILFILKSIIKNRLQQILFIISILYYIAVLTLIAHNRLNFMPRYFILMLPTMLVLCSSAIISIKKNWVKVLAISLIFISNTSFLLFSQNSTPKQSRMVMTKYLASSLKEFNLTKNDVIVCPMYTGVFLKKYLKTASIFDFYPQELMHIRDRRFYPDSITKSINSNNMIERIRVFTNSGKPSEKFYKYLNDNTLNKLKSDSQLLYIVDETLYKYNLEPAIKQNILDVITSNKEFYYKNTQRAQLEYLVTTKYMMEMLNLFNNNLSYQKTIKINIAESDEDTTFYIILFKKQ